MTTSFLHERGILSIRSYRRILSKLPRASVLKTDWLGSFGLVSFGLVRHSKLTPL